MNKNKLYWVCQLGGWLVFVVLEAIGHGNVFGYTPQLFVNIIVNYFIGVAITHGYRQFLVRTQWLTLPLYQLIPRGIAGVFVMSLIMSALNIPLDRYTFPVVVTIPIDFSVLYGYFFFWGKYILLWSLIYHMFQYWEKSLTAEKERYKLEAIIKENQYNQLKTQLNPHFLFNSLNSIRTLVDLNPQLSKEAINRLAALLRSSLHMGKSKTIPLREELQIVDDYLAIEKIRLDDKLKINKDITSETMDLQVPALMMQTLAENAIKHGIANIKSGGELLIKSFIQDGYHVIELLNDGVYDSRKNTNGVGIQNTKQRLSILYNDMATFDICGVDQNKVKVTIKIPI